MFDVHVKSRLKPAYLFSAISRLGSEPTDSQEVRVRKTVLLSTALMIAIAGLIWGSIYIFFGEIVAGSIPLAYSIFSFASVVYFSISRQFSRFRFHQLLLILLLPFFLMLSLGGYSSGSAVVLWSFLSPLGAMLVGTPRQALRWFLAYLVLVLVSGLVQPFLKAGNNLPPAVVIGFFVMNVGAVSSIAFILLYYFLVQKDTAMTLLTREQERSEQLLLNVLPGEIAAILKIDDSIIADQYESASIMFADMVDFTPLSAEMAPRAAVIMLNELYSHFDSLVEKYDLEKIRTIGDNYMVAAGVPRPRPDHAQALAYMALEMAEYMKQATAPGGKPLSLRIGINSGTVVAGVIGRQKFHYDVWGDPVNLASRMESQGVPGKIQIAAGTYRLINDRFDCVPRGPIEVKGRGRMNTWYLEGVKHSGDPMVDPADFGQEDNRL